MHRIKTHLLIEIFIFLYKIVRAENAGMEPYVVKGEFAQIGSYPHCVFITVDCEGPWKCGSSVVNQRILLTAAHCLYCPYPKPKVEVFAGHENINKVKVKRGVKKTLIHEKYHDKDVSYDIGLVLLSADLPLGKKIKRVIITRQSNYGLQAVVAGWGLVSDDPEESTNTLKSVKQKVRSAKICNKIGKLTPDMMCAGSTKQDHPRPSKGDSGSALITSKFRQIGVVSFRYPGYPSLVVYANVSYFYDWIKHRSRSMYCGK